MASRHQWPPGFRFRPTDQELVAFYLSRKVFGRPIQPGIIAEVDLYKCEPWDLPDKSSFENDVEWYFFSPRDKKYPNGSRTNRATEAGYWKATGKDRVVRSCSKGIGMKKTLVFYKGRAPHGQRTDWIMHEYRLEEVDSQQFQDAFVLCRVFRKTTAKNEEEIIPAYLDEEFNCSSSIVPAEKDAADILAPAEPDEGQICSPSSTENRGPVPQGNSSVEVSPVAASGPEDVADDSLETFLMMLLDEPTPEESQVLALAHSQENPIPREASLEFLDPAFCAFGEEAEMLEQLQESLQGSQNNEAVENSRYTSGEDFSMMDLLAGDFLELNDLINAGDQDGINQQPLNTTQMPTEDMTTYLENLGPQISRTPENTTSIPSSNLHPKVAPSNWMETLRYESEGDALSQIMENGVDDISGRSLVSPFSNASDVRWKSLEVTNIGNCSAAGDLTTELYGMGSRAESGLQKAEAFISSIDSANTSAESEQNDPKQHHRLKRFLNMLGSVHVLPASAAEYPSASESRLRSKLVLKGTSGSTDSSIHLTAMNLCVTAVTVTCSCPKKHHDGETKQAPSQACITKHQRGYGGNLFFVFLLGSVSALFWILLLPSISRLASCIHAVL